MNIIYEVKFYWPNPSTDGSGKVTEGVTADKLAALGPGPWMEEPDYEAFRVAGYPCVIRRNQFGNWCGYVAVPPGHPWHGIDFSDWWEESRPAPEVHGGITFASKCVPDMGICHVPEPGESDDVWWLGFDTAHAFDVNPALERVLVDRGGAEGGFRVPGQAYRDYGYIKEQVHSLALQAARVC